MRCLLSFFLLSAAVSVMAQVTRPAVNDDHKGKYISLYAPGIINPAAGTVELTLDPSKPGTEFESEWSFALEMVPAQPSASASARNVFGIYVSSGENNVRKLFAVVRNEAGQAFFAGTGREVLVKDKLINLACSWGPNGLRLYVNGVLRGSGKFAGEIGPMPALFRICRGVPFRTRAMRVSVRQLADRELGKAGSVFTAGPETSFIANRDFVQAEYRMVDGLGNFSYLLPVWKMLSSFNAAGTPAILPLIAGNYTARPVTYLVKIKSFDLERRPVAEKEHRIELPPKTLLTEQRLSLPVTLPGYYDLEMTVVAPGQAARLWRFSQVIMPPAEVGVKDGKFADYLGHHLFNLPEVLKKLNLRWSRSDCFQWYLLEPEKGRFDWAWTDKMVDNATRNGVNYLGILASPPVWAASPEVKPGHPNAFMAARRKPRDVAEWENYVFQVVSRYKDRVKYWEIWNEVDWHPPGPAASFSGTTQDYFTLLQAAWRAAKKADPECRILISGFGYGSLCDRKMPFDLLEMGAAKYCDIYNIHSYQGLWGIDPLLQAVAKHRPGMPSWQTEQMWHTIADRKKQGLLTAAMFFWFIDKGFEKYFSFGEDFFFSHYTRGPNPVVATLAAMQNNLRKCAAYTGTLTDSKLKYYDLKHAFRRTDGRYFTALGKVGAPVALELAGDIRTVEDAFGRPVPFTRQGDRVTTTPTELLFVVSGKPLQVLAERSVVGNLCPNGGFEEISGDIAMGGLGNAIVSGWQFREKTYDSAGTIRLVKTAHSGSYALELTSSGKGRVYAFFEQRINEPGNYELSVWMANPGKVPVEAYLAVFDRTSNDYRRFPVGPITPGGFRLYRMPVNFAKPSTGNVAFIVGLDQAGTIVCDDAVLAPRQAEPLAGTRVLPVKNRIEKRTFSRGKATVSVDDMVKHLGDGVTVSRIPFKNGGYPVMLSAAPWSNSSGSSFRVAVDGQCARLALLLTAMYVPERAGKLGSVKLVYADGKTAETALENGRQLRDWFLTANASGVTPAWKFLGSDFHEFGIFLVEIANSRPGIRIAAVDIQAASEALLAVVAVTAVP